ncbi:unnamed protein product [Lactuca virosa]|uniref:Uncharacterized protein n=1 Tax=Lactuca virosa TaxID=75947 RepID=A0AAU9PHF5_9ASTR|nr:unnamed protein product [Lactuca virosa]
MVRFETVKPVKPVIGLVLRCHTSAPLVFPPRLRLAGQQLVAYPTAAPILPLVSLSLATWLDCYSDKKPTSDETKVESPYMDKDNINIPTSEPVNIIDDDDDMEEIDVDDDVNVEQNGGATDKNQGRGRKQSIVWKHFNKPDPVPPEGARTACIHL